MAQLNIERGKVVLLASASSSPFFLSSHSCYQMELMVRSIHDSGGAAEESAP
jgi:hypothetical protein